jgi:hypothetical protein
MGNSALESIMEDKIASLIREVEQSMKWMQGRIYNIKHGSPFSNESPDIELEARCIADKIHDMRVQLIKERLEKQEQERQEKLVGQPGEDLGYKYFPSTKEDWDL